MSRAQTGRFRTFSGEQSDHEFGIYLNLPEPVRVANGHLSVCVVRMDDDFTAKWNGLTDCILVSVALATYEWKLHTLTTVKKAEFFLIFAPFYFAITRC